MPGVSTGIAVGSGTYSVTDQNGDGLDDLVLANSAASNAIYYAVHNGPGIHPDLAISFTDGYGLAAKPSYVSIAQSTSGYTSYNDSAFPYIDFVGPLEVVSSVVFTDPSNAATGTYTQTLLYSAMWSNLQGRGLTPFQAVQTTDSRNNFSLYKNYFRSFPYTGMQSGFFSADPNSYPVSQGGSLTWNTTLLDSTPNNQRYFPYVLTSYRYDYELRPNNFTTYPTWVTDTENSYVYDNFGNPTNITTVATDTDPTSPFYNDSWTSTTVNSFTPSTTTWCLNLPTGSTVTNSNTAPNGAAITRTVAYNNPDYTYCRETDKVIEPNSSAYKVVEDYVYDTSYGNFGNLHSTTVTGVGMSPRVTTTLWTSNGQFPLTVTNPLSQSVNLVFDPNTGMKTSQTDLNFTTTNPLKTLWTYDNFAREQSETRFDGTSTTIAYDNCTTNGCVNSNNKMTVTKTAVNVGGSTLTKQSIYLDELDRPLVTSSLMLNGAYDRREVQYDNLGNVHQQGAPCTFVGCATYWTTNTYDALHRLIQSQRPTSATNGTLQTTTVAYAGRTTTMTDPSGHATTKINLVTGNLARSKDALGYYQNFGYDAFGSLLTVVDSNAYPLFTATYDYGIGAFQRNVTDMDLDKSTAAGQHRLYTYDALGELTNWTDAKGQSFSTTYDALSRPLVRTEPDLTTTWNWGGNATRYDLGKLNYVSSTDSLGTLTDSYFYDSKTRLVTETLALPGDNTYAYNFSYNATTGLLDTLQYPVSTSAYQLKLQYGYANGILQKISDFNNASTVFWTANTLNPRGQVTQETLGNGVITNRSIDAVTGRVNSIQAGVGGGTGLLNSSYLFDDMGDVTQRQNNTLGLTESFFYDTDYRLDHSTLNGTVNLQMHYDTTGMGNIASRSDVASGAAWTYDPVRKHAVTQAGSASNSYTYDSNGNATSRNGSANTIAWSSYNYPTAINAPGEAIEFWYGPNRQRWKSFYTSSTTTETTYHVGKLLEKVANASATDYRHYIFAGSEPVAIYSRTSAGTNTLRYTLEDHQGSFAAIVSSSGTPVVNENFSAYGNRRNASTWSGAPTTGDETAINGISREGYTDQTALGVSMGLNHLNGRVADAITGRFLSPDPYVPHPGNTQNFNRYSYVNNNPLSRIDPSGFDDIVVTCCTSNDSGGGGIFGTIFGAIGNFFDGLFGGGGGGPPPAPNGISRSAALPSIGSNFNSSSIINDPSIQAAAAGYFGADPNHFELTNVGSAPAGAPIDSVPQIDGLTVTGHTYYGYNFGSPGWTPISMGRALGQFAAITVGGAGGWAFKGGYAGIGAVAGALGGGKSTNWSPGGMLIGAGIGSLTGGAGFYIGDAAGLTGLSAVGFSSATGGVAGGASTLSMNLLTGNPNVWENVGYASSIGALAPLASGEAMVIGGAGFAPDSALGYILNAGSNVFAVGLGP